MHDMKLLGFLEEEEMSWSRQTLKGSLGLIISNLFPLPLALLTISVACHERKVINISWEVDHGLRRFLMKQSCVSRVRSCYVLSCVLPGSATLKDQQLGGFALILCLILLLFQENTCPMAGVV